MKPCAPWGMAILQPARPLPGRWRMAFTIREFYLAGGYNRLRTNVAGRVVENEDLVNFPNWLPLNFHIADEVWFDARTNNDSCRIARNSTYSMASCCVPCASRTNEGRRTLLQEQRLVSMADMHLGAHAAGR